MANPDFKNSLRCTLCGISWPPIQGEFNPCPQCEDATFPIQRAPSMTLDDARSARRVAMFERFYEEWDSNRTEPLLPETPQEAFERYYAKRENADEEPVPTSEQELKYSYENYMASVAKTAVDTSSDPDE